MHDIGSKKRRGCKMGFPGFEQYIIGWGGGRGVFAQTRAGARAITREGFQGFQNSPFGL